MVQQPNLIRRPLLSLSQGLVVGFDRVAKARLAEILGRPI
jgi:arsenate reductase-like glutaredoxin family protein